MFPSLPPCRFYSSSFVLTRSTFRYTHARVIDISRERISRRFDASVRTYVRMYDEFGLGRKIPRCSRFTRERAVLFWSESSARERARKRHDGRAERRHSLKCMRYMHFPSIPNEYVAPYLSELYWPREKSRRKHLAERLTYSSLRSENACRFFITHRRNAIAPDVPIYERANFAR